jgi:hypothetical protein
LRKAHLPRLANGPRNTAILKASLRPQWRREWLTAPPFTPAFDQGQQEFQLLLAENDYALLEKLPYGFKLSIRSRARSSFRMPQVRLKGLTASAWRTS